MSKETQKAKMALIKSMMGNPKIAKIIHESVSSPLGSTKRQRAKSVISIINKTNPKRVYTGKGGFMDIIGGGSSTAMSNVSGLSGLSTTSTPQSLKTALAPAPKAPDYSAFAGQFGNMTASGGATILPSAPSFKTLSVSAAPSSFKITDSLNDINRLVKTGAIQPIKLETYKAPDPAKDARDKMLSEIATKGIQNTPYGSAGAYTDPLMRDTGSASVINPLFAGATDLTKLNVPEPITAKPESTKKETKIEKPDGTVQKVTEETKGATPIGPSKSPYQANVPVSASEFFGTTGTTPVTGASSAKGATGVSAPTIPTGSAGATKAESPAGTEAGGTTFPTPTGKITYGLAVEQAKQKQYEELQKTLKEQYDLDDLLRKKEEIEKQSPMIKQDMTDYIRARDEYVGHVDKLIQDASDTFHTSDVSDPENRKRMSNYMSYLTTLKSNHNQRYSDYLNKSIDQFNAEVKRIDDDYKDAVTSYNSALKTGGESLDNTAKALIKLNDDLIDAPMKELERQQKLLSLYKTQLDIIKDTTGSASDSKFIDNVQKNGEYVWDKNGIILDDINIPSDTAYLIAQGSKPEEVASAMMWGINKKITSEASDGNSTALKVINDRMKEIIDMATSPQFGGNQTDEDQAVAWKNLAGQMGTTILDRSGDAVSKYILNKDPEDAKSLITDLGARPGMLWGTKPAKTREEYISEHEDTFEPELLNSLYNTFIINEKIKPGENYSEKLNLEIANQKDSGKTEQEIVADIISDMSTRGWTQTLAQVIN